MARGLEAQQIEMRRLLRGAAPLPVVLKYAAGLDITEDGPIAVAALVVVDIDTLAPVYERYMPVSLPMRYASGLLCFREGPAMVDLLRGCSHRIDVVLCDGSGIWQQRGFGLACYVSLETGLPAIGVSKTWLAVNGERMPEFLELGMGEVKMVETVVDGLALECAIMRTTTSMPFRPVFVSVGDLLSLGDAVSVVRRLCRYREPEPLRLADRGSRKVVRDAKRA